jgi:urease accessory protein
VTSVPDMSTSRHDPAWYTPADLPPDLAGRDTPLADTLGVGAAGKVGVLDLTFARSAGTTRLQRQYQQSPMYIYRPIYLDPDRPDMAFVFLLQSGDGLVQGDRYRIDVDCLPGAAVHVTTQAATKVFTARQNFASQLVNLRTGAGAVLEYLPEPVVPFRGSRLYQRTRITADPDSTVIVGETLLPGRVARGEHHAYNLYWAETELRDRDQGLLFTDTLRFSPTDDAIPNSMGLLATYDVIATLYVITGRMDPVHIVALLRQALSGSPNILAGVSELPNSCGASVRLLGPDSNTVKAAIATAWNAARTRLIGAPAPNLRKG